MSLRLAGLLLSNPQTKENRQQHMVLTYLDLSVSLASLPLGN